MAPNLIRRSIIALLACYSCSDVAAFSTSSAALLNLVASSHKVQRSARYAAGEESNDANGTSSPVGGGLVSFDDLKSQLVSAFTSLDETDQYDAVLTGLCAKILDDTAMSSENVKDALGDPMQLLQEMNSRKIRASGRSLMALIDVSLDFGERSSFRPPFCFFRLLIIRFVRDY